MSLAATVSLPQESDGLISLEGKIDLEYYKLIKVSEESITLMPSDKGFAGIKGDAGAPAQKEFAPSPISWTKSTSASAPSLRRKIWCTPCA
ncbi:hypothetical protein [uncultured Desulfovibrio sp.]|uniref:hypothetical protein n=1 Tax=uncultured Desulfovibrio sp. TaxID=167968 RepID=UPI0026300F1A|nr:hypothetical protein [uncultured Desulfovibrio sp.]